MSDDENQFPQGTVIPPIESNPYHAGYNQPGNFGIGNVNQDYNSNPQQTMHINSGFHGMSSNPISVVTGQPHATTVTNQNKGSDLLIPAFLACVFCCVCTGIPAVIYAVRAQEEYKVGNSQAADINQRNARGWIIGSIALHAVMWIIGLILYFVMPAIIKFYQL